MERNIKMEGGRGGGGGVREDGFIRRSDRETKRET